MQTSNQAPQRQLMESLFTKLGYEGNLGDQISKFRAENGLTATGEMEAKSGDVTFDTLRQKVETLTKAAEKAPKLDEGERKLLGLESAPVADPRIDKSQSVVKGPSADTTRARLDAQLPAEAKPSARLGELAKQPVPVPGKSTSDYVRPGEASAGWVQDRMLDVLGRDKVPDDVKSDYSKTVKYYQDQKGLRLEGQNAGDGKAGPQTLGQLEKDLRAMPEASRPKDATTRAFLKETTSAETGKKGVNATKGTDAVPGKTTDAAKTTNAAKKTDAATEVEPEAAFERAGGGGLAPVIKKAVGNNESKTTAKADAKATTPKEAPAAKPMKLAVSGGDTQREVAERAAAEAKKTGRPQSFTFNGKKITVSPGDTADQASWKIGEKTGNGFSADRAQDPEFRKAVNERLAKDGVGLKMREGESLNEFRQRSAGYAGNVNKAINDIDTTASNNLREKINADLKKNGLPTIRAGETVDDLVKRQAGNYGDAIDKVAEKYRLNDRGALNKALQDRGLSVRMGEGQSVKAMLEGANGAEKASAQKVVGELMSQGKLGSLQFGGAVRAAPSAALEAAATSASTIGKDLGSAAAKVGRGTLSVASKAALPLGVAMSAYELHEAYEKDKLRDDGKMTETKKAVGREGGGWAGAAGGAAVGAAAGSAVLPVVGTAVGAIVGGVIGYAGGSEIGESMMTEREGGPTSISEMGPAA